MNLIEQLSKLPEEKLSKLIKLLDNIEVLEDENNVVIKVSKNVTVITDGNLLLYSKDGVLVTKHKRIHINPAIKINIKKLDTVQISNDALNKRLLIEKMDLFTNLLKHGKIKYIQ